MCDNIFSQFVDLNIHVRVHMGDKPYKYSLWNIS